MKAISSRKMFFQGMLLGGLTWLAIYLAHLWFGGKSLPGYRCTPAGCKQANWLDVVLLIMVAQFLYLKSWLMLRRSNNVTLLGASLVWANLAFAVAYQFAILYTIFPILLKQAWLTTLLRIEVLVPVLFGTIMLTLTEDPALNAPSVWDEVDRLQAENVHLSDLLARCEGNLRAMVDAYPLPDQPVEEEPPCPPLADSGSQSASSSLSSYFSGPSASSLPSKE